MKTDLFPNLRALSRSILSGSLALLTAALAGVPAAQAATFIWKGGAGSNSWTLNGNWTTSAPANDGTADLNFTSAFFTGTDFIFPNLNVDYSIRSMTFNGTKGFNLKTDAARTLTIGNGGLTQNSAAEHFIEHAVSLGAAQTWTLVSGSGTLHLLGGVANGGNLLSVTSSSGANTLNAVITGTGGLAKSGAGNLTLSSASTFTGGTAINGGTLTLLAGGSLLNTFAQVAPGATLTINGGSLNAGTAAYFTVGNAASATAATANLLGGTLTTAESDIGAFPGSVGVFAHSGGTHITDLILGTSPNSSGAYTMSGAASQLTTAISEIGRQGTGLFTQNGGTHTAINNVVLGGMATGAGTYALNGGTLQAGLVGRIAGTGTFLFNGGTLQALRNEPGFVNGLNAARVQAGGAKIESGGFNITISQPLLHEPALGATRDGGLVKSGAGTLTLTGASTFTGGTLVSGGTLTIGSTGSLTNTRVDVNPGGTFTINGGSVNASNAAYFVVGSASGVGAANGNLLGGSLTALAVEIGSAAGSTGAFTHSGGTLSAPSGVTLGVVETSAGSYTLSGAASQLTSPTLLIAGSGVGTFTQSAGTATLSNNLSLGVSANGNGTFNLQGGQFSAPFVYVGERSVGIFNHTGGTLTAGGTIGVVLGSNVGANGTYHLSGGTLQTQQVSGGAGASTFHFNGGTLQAQRTEANLMTGVDTVRVQTGGAKINSNGFNLTIAQPLLHDTALGATRDGGLVKSGGGTLTLTAANTYTGRTTVSGGTLTIAAGGSITNSLIEANAGGTITINGGSVNTGAAAFFQIGNNAGTATGNLLGGTITSTESDLGNVANSVATFTHSGGTHTVGGGLFLAVATSSTATYTFSGASSTVSANETNIGWRGTGTFTQTAGTHTAGVVNLGNFSVGNGTYRLSGGTLKTHKITRGTGTGTFYFDGGTIELTASDSGFLTSTVTNYLGVGGMKIDTHGFDATISRPLLHDPALGTTPDGGVTKSGAGNLTFTTSQKLASLTIQAGTVTLAASAPAPAPLAGGPEFEDALFGNAAASTMGGESLAQAVPEPGVATLLLAAGALFCSRRSRNAACPRSVAR